MTAQLTPSELLLRDLLAKQDTDTPSCPDCGRVDPCPRCRIAARLANPHNDPQFRSGAKPCRCCQQWITEHDFADGAFVCQMETTT